MEPKKQNHIQNNNNISSNIINENNHGNCYCKEKISYKKDFFKQKLIFIPIIIIKILLSLYLYESFYCYNLKNELDLKYSKKAFLIYIIYLFILYFINIFLPETQSDIDKYINLDSNNNPKKELIIFKQNYLMCNFCHKAKFIRSSHCRLCDKCISFRDHHCPFTANCIGYNNMQYFLNFCFWASYGIIFYIFSYVNFRYNNLSILMKTIIKVDFITNIFVLSSLFLNLLRSFVNIYNNRTHLENIRQVGIEIKFPIYDFYKEKNKSSINNLYNIGFLSHLFYVVGPTLLHFILPLPKFKNYILNENCPIFSKSKEPDRFQIFKYHMKKNPNYLTEIIEKSSNPDDFINLSLKYYNDKIII